MKYYIILLVSCACLLISCEDLLTKEIPLEDVGYQPLLVLNAEIVNDQNQILASVTQNKSTADVDFYNYEFLNDASLTLSVNGETYNSTVIDTSDFYNHIFVLPENVDYANQVFEITGSHPDLPEVFAMTRMPAKANVEEINFDPKSVPMTFDDEKWDQIDFFLNDDEGQENFYRISIQAPPVIDTFINGMDTSYFEYEPYIDISSDNPLFESNSENFLYFSDENFNGNRYLISFTTNLSTATNNQYEEASLIIESISKEKFLFQTSLARYFASGDFGFFSEPVTIYTNIENGLGVFMSLNSSSYKLEE